MNKRIQLPPQVAAIYRATAELQKRYPGRPFTPDGHLVGSIGEVVAAEALGLTLYPPSHLPRRLDENGDVQISRLTAGKSVGMYSCCNRLVVLKVVSRMEPPRSSTTGPATLPGRTQARRQKTGQRPISLARLKKLASEEKAQ